MRCIARLPLHRAVLLAALAWAAAPAQETRPVPEPATAAVPAAHANRVLFHPIASFFINGVNGAYERRFAQGRLGLHVPFYLGRLVIADRDSETTLGGGLGFDLFLSSAASGGRFSLTAEGVDLKRREYAGYGFDSDPSFPGDGQSPYDTYHQYAYSASLTFGYRWEYPDRLFLADLAFGGGFTVFGGPGPSVVYANPYRSRAGEIFPPLAFQGLMPVVRFSLGIPF